MSRHDIIIFVCGSLASTLALLFMQMARSFGRRDVEGELLAALQELREYFADQQTCPREMECALARADLAIALATAETQS